MQHNPWLCLCECGPLEFLLTRLTSLSLSANFGPSLGSPIGEWIAENGDLGWRWSMAQTSRIS